MLLDAQLGRRQQIAEPERVADCSDRNREIAAGTLWRSGRRLHFLADEQGRKSRRRDLNVSNDELRHKNRAVDNDQLSAVGQVDDEIGADDLDIVKGNTGGQRNDAIRPWHDAGRMNRVGHMNGAGRMNGVTDPCVLIDSGNMGCCI